MSLPTTALHWGHSPTLPWRVHHRSSLRGLSSSSSHLSCSCSRFLKKFRFQLVIDCYRPLIARRATMKTEPESDDAEERELSEDGTSPSAVDGQEQNSGDLNFESTGDSEKHEPDSMALLDFKDSINNIGGNFAGEVDIQDKDDDMDVASGSPLPGMKNIRESIRISKATIDILKDQVFGFDTFFVTNQEPYEGGVLFRGNLRGQAAKSYEKITKRMQDRFEDQYKFFLLIDPEDDKPVAVVAPKQAFQTEATAVPEWFAASAFGLVTIFTLLLRNVPALQSNLLSIFNNLDLLKDGLPGAIVTALILGSHEAGHILLARDVGVKLGIPFFIPSWQIGSFGAITRILSIVANRVDLLKLAAAGPLAGFLLGLVFFLLGLILPPADGIGIIVDPAVFHESFLAGGIAKLVLGDALREGTPISVNPLVLWSWAGLLINGINMIPTGELDGGRISFALWGRKVGARLSGVTLALLGVSSLFSDVAFYWAVLVFFLQRGPIAPLHEEITEPEGKYVGIGVAVLVLGLLICLPYPFTFVTDGTNFDF
ncbi:probable zinc metalloprotease EGY2, chloroplastic [Phalaenopsis equestris]|uniref:probable zinc metalloprotease EGY2, chloroplastic n=1 Tax=Phalaenopsis equestris TaxID=78828 RepID=UPI0009E4F120|nr:probable zinc metalloprotease EGY2, chloroplastic [Phalaenopsis equestris]